MAPQPDVASPGAELSLESARNLADGAVASLVPLNGLSRSERRELLRASSVVSLADGTEVGLDDVGYDQAVFVLEGVIELRRAGETIAEIAAGTEDARFALNQLRARDVTALAAGAVRLLRLDISLVSTLLLWAQSAAAAGLATAAAPGGSDQEDAVEWLPNLLSSELFSSIPSANLHRVFEVMEPLAVPAGEVVVRQGEPGVYYYVVRRGRFEVTRQPSDGEDAYRLAELGPGDSFGEEALVSESRRNATVTARSDGELLRLTKEDFVTLIVQPALQVVEHARAEAMVGDGACWLDVRLTDEHRNDGLASSINIPLHELRTRREELARDGRYVVYCDTGRRSAAGCALLRGWGLEAYVLAGGLLDRAADASSHGLSRERAERRLKEELARADAELEAALRLKVEATAARRIFAAADQPDREQSNTERERARLRAKLKRLELESHAAGQALSQAQRRRLEAEASLRAEAAAAEKARAEAAAQVERLQASTEEKLKTEQARIGKVYAKGEARIGELQAQRRALEAEFEQERARMEAELTARLEAIEREAEGLHESMARTREEGEHRTAALRREQDAEAESVRSQTEQRLRSERERLEAGFADATRQIEAARKRMDELRARREEADREARELATALREAADERRRAAQAEWEAEQTRLRTAVEGARSRVQEARSTKDAAEAERCALYEELERLRARSPGRAGDDGAPPAPAGAPGEATLSESLAEQEAKVAAAQGAVERAEQAHRAAQSAADAAEAKEAEESAAEKELRLRLYAEAESWLEEEKARSDRELQSAQAQLEAMQRARFEAEARKLTERTQDLSMISDIRAQLGAGGSPDALARAMGNKAYAERRAAAVKSAREIAAQERHAAEGELERARAHIERLRRQQHPPPSTDPEEVNRGS